jgi:glyoxylase-like metal-dependent hydrolase (beta-lactamase superfamily II)
MTGETRPIEIAHRVFQLELPTPYPIGPVYVYLLREEPITLIDTGVNSKQSLASLKEQLRHLNVQMSQIERILITHGHSDHYGAAQTMLNYGIKRAHIHTWDMDKVTHRTDYYLRMKPYLATLGMPQDYQEHYVKFIAWETPYAIDLERVSPLKDGERLSHGHLVLEILHVPGHSPGHVVFIEKNEKWAITGDFIFAQITPDPILDIPHSGERTPSMPLHMESLKKFIAQRVETYFPGHKEKRGKVNDALEQFKIRMAYKKNLFLQALKGRSLTPFQLMRELYPNSRKGEAFVLLSEVIGRLDLLKEEKMVESYMDKGLVYYRTTGE